MNQQLDLLESLKENDYENNNMELGLMKIPFKEYCQIDAINSSKLKEYFSDRQLYYKKYISKELPLESEERHLILGRLIHCAVLEPEKLTTDFIVGEYKKSSKVGLNNLAQAKASGISLISQEEINLAQEIARELPEQYEWYKNIANAINIYVEIVIVIQVGNMKFKVMLDRCLEHKDVVYIDDIKSTSKQNALDMDKAICDYDYLLQYAFYRFVAESYFKKPVIMRFVFCSKEQPFNRAFIVMDDAQYKLGRDIINKALTNLIKENWKKEQDLERPATLPKYLTAKYLNYLERK